jgi:hypothetical protein
MTSQAKKTLFDLIVEPNKVHASFERLRASHESLPARTILDEIYQEFEDPDGNFLEQFQTTGFDSRFFELYLYAYFIRSNYVVNRSYSYPDFLVTKDGLTIAIEATTVNPTSSGVVGSMGKNIRDLSDEDLVEYHRNELPIRFGSPLYSKLQRRYWEAPQCQGIPFVLAIEAFHDEEALRMSESSLVSYVYGLEHFANWIPDGSLEVSSKEIHDHQIGPKIIPSNFFSQPDCEHISAIIFTNSGTHGKLQRMGYMHGYGNDKLRVKRYGYAFNPDKDAMEPTLFGYDLGFPPYVETWGQGLVVLHNPNSVQPLPHDFFIDAMQGYIKDSRYMNDGTLRCPHVISSTTQTAGLSDHTAILPSIFVIDPPIAIGAVSRSNFQSMWGMSLAEDNPLIEERGWYTDETESFLGVVFRDKIDDDWAHVILARDECFQFRSIEAKSSLRSRRDAVNSLYSRMYELLRSPQRIFPQGQTNDN